MGIHLYDNLIERAQELLKADVKELGEGDINWPSDSDRSMILRPDMAYELGGEGCHALGVTIVTSSAKLVDGDRVFLLGRDLSDIKEDVSFARFAIVRISEEVTFEENELYDVIRRLENTRYHFYPKGFMMRVSSTKQRESVRVSELAIEHGISFEKTGRLMIEAYKKNPMVKAVHLYYVTDDFFDYPFAKTMANEVEDITCTIDHILKNVTMDCNSCNLQSICDQVDGLRELHFKQKNNIY